MVAVLYVLRLVEPLLKRLRKPAERWSQGWARALEQCGEIEPDHVGAAIMVRCPALLMTDGQNVQLIVVQSGKLGKGVTFAHQALDQQQTLNMLVGVETTTGFAPARCDDGVSALPFA